MATTNIELYDCWIKHGLNPSIATHLQNALYPFTVQELMQQSKESILSLLNSRPEIKRHHKNIVFKVLEEKRMRLLHGNTRNTAPVYFFWIDGHFSPPVAKKLYELFWFIMDVNTILAMPDETILQRLNSDTSLTHDTKLNAFMWVKQNTNMYQ